MGNFRDRVEDLVSISVTDNNELSQFLSDGVVDVTNRWISVKPEDIENFTRESAEQTSNGFNPGTNKIVSVFRENGTNGEWYPCIKKPIDLQYLVTDPDSLHYASKHNPVYMITQNRNVHVFPLPSDSGNDGFKVLYVNYDAEELDGTDLDYASTAIKWFPDDKVYLVVIYAAMRLLQAHMGLKEMPFQPVFLEITPSSASYNNSVAQVTSAFSSIDTALDGDDTELAQARIQEAQIVISNELNHLQSDVQVDNIQIAQFSADATANVQRYQAAVQSMGAEYQWLQDQHSRSICSFKS